MRPACTGPVQRLVKWVGYCHGRDGDTPNPQVGTMDGFRPMAAESSADITFHSTAFGYASHTSNLRPFPQMPIGRQGLQALIHQRPAYREVIQTLEARTLQAQQFVHGIVEETTDAGAAHAGGFGFEI